MSRTDVPLKRRFSTTAVTLTMNRPSPRSIDSVWLSSANASGRKFAPMPTASEVPMIVKLWFLLKSSEPRMDSPAAVMIPKR